MWRKISFIWLKLEVHLSLNHSQEKYDSLWQYVIMVFFYEGPAEFVKGFKFENILAWEIVGLSKIRILFLTASSVN
jgi:hypothetical protein